MSSASTPGISDANIFAIPVMYSVKDEALGSASRADPASAAARLRAGRCIFVRLASRPDGYHGYPESRQRRSGQDLGNGALVLDLFQETWALENLHAGELCEEEDVRSTTSTMPPPRSLFPIGNARKPLVENGEGTAQAFLCGGACPVVVMRRTTHWPGLRVVRARRAPGGRSSSLHCRSFG